MIKIEGRHITISRGDCESFTITLTGNDTPENGEKVLFTVKKSTDRKDPAIEKLFEVYNGIIIIHILSADTKLLPFGEYEWDIRFPNYFSENEPHTPMEPAPFTIARVVGNV